MRTKIETQTIGKIVAENYKTASVFKQHGIDFCCNGNRTIAYACEQKNLDTNSILAQVQDILNQEPDGAVDYKSWPLDLMTDYIVKKHHNYVENTGLELKGYVAKIARVHGKTHPELLQVETLYNNVIGELVAHMKKEELILFPFIKNMVQTQDSKAPLTMPGFGSIENPINMMHHEHDDAGEMFRQIRDVTDNYELPHDACNTYMVTFKLLNEFEEDLHLHIHLENNILFPKAIALQAELQQNCLLK
jgi:regulator of cell morphogenesis and NO signaling